MRELGVIVQPTGDRHERAEDEAADVHVDRGSADFFVDMLDRVLTTGW